MLLNRTRYENHLCLHLFNIMEIDSYRLERDLNVGHTLIGWLIEYWISYSSEWCRNRRFINGHHHSTFISSFKWIYSSNSHSHGYWWPSVINHFDWWLQEMFVVYCKATSIVDISLCTVVCVHLSDVTACLRISQQADRNELPKQVIIMEDCSYCRYYHRCCLLHLRWHCVVLLAKEKTSKEGCSCFHLRCLYKQLINSYLRCIKLRGLQSLGSRIKWYFVWLFSYLRVPMGTLILCIIFGQN